MKLSNYFYKTLYFLIICVISFIVWNHSFQIPGYENVFLLPLTYAILILFTSATKYIRSNVGILIFNLVAFVRYVGVIFIGAVAGFPIWRGISPHTNSIRDAIWLMLIEMVCVFIFIELFNKRYYGSSKLNLNKDKIYSKNSIIIKLFILLGIVSALIFPQVLARYSLVANLGNYTPYVAVVHNPLISLVELIIGFAKILLIIFIIVYLKKKHEATGKIKYVLFSIIVLLINSMIVLDLSRFSILISSAAGLFLLIKLYKKYSKFITPIIVFGIIISIFAASYFKFSRGNTTFDLAWWSDTLQMYFAGPKNVAIALDMASTYKINPIIQIFRDTFSSVAGIAGSLNQDLNIVSLYNLTYYGSSISRDQIVPLLGQGVFYFGYLGSMIPSIFAIWMMMWFDHRSVKDNNPYGCYVSYYMAAWFGSAMMINWTTLFSYFINTFVFLMIVIKIDNMVNLKIRIK